MKTVPCVPTGTLSPAPICRAVVPTLVPRTLCMKPGLPSSCLLYTSLAGYQGGEINDLVDRTVGRDSTTEFLYKGRCV